VLDAKAYLMKENSYEIIGMKEVVKHLKNNTGFKNIILKSQIGNQNKNQIDSASDLYDLNQE
jgi:ribosomal protein L30E